MTKVTWIAATIISAALLPASAGESAVLGKAGLTLPSIEVPAPEAPKSNMWLVLRKIQLNTAAPEMNDKLVGLLDRGFDAYTAVRELTQAGFKAQAYQSNTGGYMIFLDVAGQDAADLAVGLARYYYITEVRVGRQVYGQIFGLTNKSPRNGNQWLTLRKISVNSAQPDANDTLIGLVQHGEAIDKVTRELSEGGFKVKAYQDNTGGYMVMADVKGLNAADYAVGLARYYYITEVRVGQAVYNNIFGLSSAR